MPKVTELLTSRQAAEQLGVSVRTVVRMAGDGRLMPATQLAGYRGALLFTPSAVLRTARKIGRAA